MLSNGLASSQYYETHWDERYWDAKLVLFNISQSHHDMQGYLSNLWIASQHARLTPRDLPKRASFEHASLALTIHFPESNIIYQMFQSHHDMHGFKIASTIPNMINIIRIDKHEKQRQYSNSIANNMRRYVQHLCCFVCCFLQKKNLKIWCLIQYPTHTVP